LDLKIWAKYQLVKFNNVHRVYSNKERKYMKWSKYFSPTLKEIPADAQIVSHQLMIRAGLIAQECAGIYYWLPQGLKVLRNIARIVQEEQDKAGFNEILIPTLQPSDLWQESNRYDDYGKEMLRIKDRHDRELLYGPTAEEAVTDIFRKYIKSYKDLPMVLYQIQWKFRDEIRPRFGVMRGREFLMKDGYSFDISQDAAKETYRKVMKTYISIFQKIGLQAMPVKADTGPIGGDLSHEFLIVAETGESTIYYDKAFDDLKLDGSESDLDKLMAIYSATDELHDPDNCPVPKSSLKHKKGIEIGHIFYFGDKYAEPMNAKVMNESGQLSTVYSGSYGIGISRMVAAIIEASHDENGIIWPESVAPFRFGLLNLKIGNEKTDKICNDIYDKFLSNNQTILYDDRKEGAGAKFSDMDLIGLPWQIIVGPKNAEENKLELKNRKTGDRLIITLDELYNKFINK
jgi:prolyl-tRNA synthetase